VYYTVSRWLDSFCIFEIPLIPSTKRRVRSNESYSLLIPNVYNTWVPWKPFSSQMFTILGFPSHPKCLQYLGSYSLLIPNVYNTWVPWKHPQTLFMMLRNYFGHVPFFSFANCRSGRSQDTNRTNVYLASNFTIITAIWYNGQ
jgi:hypothetical protein